MEATSEGSEIVIPESCLWNEVILTFRDRRRVNLLDLEESLSDASLSCRLVGADKIVITKLCRLSGEDIRNQQAIVQALMRKLQSDLPDCNIRFNINPQVAVSLGFRDTCEDLVDMPPLAKETESLAMDASIRVANLVAWARGDIDDYSTFFLRLK